MPRRGTIKVKKTAEFSPRSVALEAQVTRADGTVEDLGEIAYYHKNPLRRLLRRFTH